MTAPQSFALDDVDGHAQAVTEEVADEYCDHVWEAAHSCPEQAIEVLVDRVVSARAAHGRRTGV